MNRQLTYKIFIDGHLFKNADGYSLVGIDNVEIDRDIKKLVDTAKITIPNEAYNTLLVRNGDIIKEGRGVQIYLGYNGQDDLYFQGWIIRIEESNKLDIFCEDQGYLFRQFVKDEDVYVLLDQEEGEARRIAVALSTIDKNTTKIPTDSNTDTAPVDDALDNPRIQPQLTTLSEIIDRLITRYNETLDSELDPFRAVIHNRLAQIGFTDFRIQRTSGLQVLAGLAKALNINIYFRRNVLYVYPYFESDPGLKYPGLEPGQPDPIITGIKSFEIQQPEVEEQASLNVNYNTEKNVQDIKVIKRIKRQYIVIGQYNGMDTDIAQADINKIVGERVEELKAEKEGDKVNKKNAVKEALPEDKKVIENVFKALQVQDSSIEKEADRHFDDNGNLKVDGDGVPKPKFTIDEVRTAVLSYFLTTDIFNKYTQVTSINEADTVLYDMVEHKKIINSIYNQADAQYINDQYLESKNYNGLSGFITTWLKPYVTFGQIANIYDQFNKNWNGNFFIERVHTIFNQNGGAHQVFLSKRIEETL